jgi:hypothetical protein
MSRNTPTKTISTRRNRTSTLPPTLTESFVVEDKATTTSSPPLDVKKKRGRPRKNNIQKTELEKKKIPREKTNNVSVEPSPSKTDTKKKNTDPVTIRPRKLLTDRKLLLLRPEDLEDVTNLQSRITSTGFERYIGGVLSVSEQDLDELVNEDDDDEEDDNQQVAEPPKKIIKLSSHDDEIPHDSIRIEIAVPKFQGIEGVRVNDQYDSKRFDKPKKYINYPHITTRYDLANEYDMQSDDEEWLHEYNKQSRKPLTDIDFERLYSLINREYGSKNGYVSVSSLADLAQLCNVRVSTNDIMSVRDWWRKKNQNLIADMTARQDKLVQMDQDFQQMQQMRNDFERLRLLFELVRKREKLKQKYHQTTANEVKILAKQKHENDILALVEEEKRLEQQKQEQKKKEQEAEALRLRRVKKQEQERELRERELRQKDLEDEGYESEDLIEELEPSHQRRKRRR